MVKMFQWTNLFTVLFIVLKTCLAEDLLATYDQRQSGKYNIHINIKDVSIIDLEGNDFGNLKPETEDYYYDDDDFTIKPISAWLTSSTFKPTSTTSKPTSTTSKPTTDSIANISVEHSRPTSEPILAINTSTSNVPANSNILNATQSTTTISELPKPLSAFTSKKPSVMIIEPDVVHKKPKPTPFPFELGGEIPVHIVVEPVLHPKLRTANQPSFRFNQRGANIPAARISNRRSGTNGRRNSQSIGTGCQRGFVLDTSGNCRSRRSPFLGKLINMIKLLSPSEE